MVRLLICNGNVPTGFLVPLDQAELLVANGVKQLVVHEAFDTTVSDRAARKTNDKRQLMVFSP